MSDYQNKVLTRRVMIRADIALETAQHTRRHYRREHASHPRSQYFADLYDAHCHEVRELLWVRYGRFTPLLWVRGRFTPR